MDEPLSNLDAKLRIQTRAEITKLHNKLKTTFIYVTHDQTEAMTMGDRIVIMKDGLIQQVDTPENVYSNPANVFVAGFIGSPKMNFIDAVIVKEGDNIFIKLPNSMIKLNEDKAKRIIDRGYLNKNIIMGIRPEHMYYNEKETDISLDGVVDFIEMLGSEKYLYLTMEGSTFIARVNSDNVVKKGDKLRIYLDDRKIHIFDKDSGRLV